ncbi:MAG TPA: lamin tail domain-containing protein [Verrucomicrobiales bacterium]|nr:lamin tail domain-containing protein [Verrucomicrobiales bacterium]
MKFPFPALALILCPPLLRAALTDGLVAHYRFDETSGTTAVDSVRGAAGNGTLSNFGPAPWVTGQIGGAVELDGSNDWITTANAIENNVATMSFSGWVWADTRPQWASMAKNWGDSLVGQYHMGLNPSGQLSNYLTNSTNVLESSVFPTGSWQQVAFTYDGTTHRLYRNGVQVAATVTTVALVRNSAVTALGCKTVNGGTSPSTSAAGYWDGKYDDFGFWNRALTAEEVSTIYNDGLAGRSIGQPASPTISNFTASPPNVPAGGTTTLSWTVQNAVSVSLTGGPFTNQDVTGQTSIVTPPLTTDASFTLTATNAVGPSTATKLVGVGASVLEPVINEFLAANDSGLEDAPIGGDREDWIEIYNPNTLYALELSGYHLTDEPDNLDKWTFPAVTLAPGAYLLVFASEKNRAVAGQTLHTNFKLSENGEYLALVKPNGATIVQEFAPTYPNQSSDISYSSAGYLAALTPGAVNSALAGPFISGVTENPPPPLDGDSLTINATVTPQNGSTVATVNLIYRINYNAEVTVPMALNAGIYSAVIPASASTPGQMIRWRITATDAAARTGKAPLYRVPTNSPEYFGTMVQDTSFTTQLPVVYRFVQTPGSIDNDPGTRCSIFLNNEFFDNCGVRIRGFTSRGWPKKSHKIEGNSGHKFRLKAGMPRVTEFDLNTTYTDKSYVRSVLTADMQRSIGMVCPDIYPVHVRQNGAFYSVALMTENPDTDMLTRYGVDPDGAYYKAPTNNLYTTSSTFEKKTRLYESGKADLDALISSLGFTGVTLETYVFDNVDIPAMMNYMATTCISQNIDASDKNHFVYRDTNGTGEWSMLPWDLDLTFGPNALNTDVMVYNQNYASHPFIGASPYLLSGGKYNRFLEAIIKTTRTKDMLIRRIRTLTDQFLVTNWFKNRIDQLVPLLDPDVTLDHAKWAGNSHFGGLTHTLLAANNRIKNEYLTPRLTYLNAGGTVGIPAAHPADAPIVFGSYDANPASHNQDEEYIQLTNNNAYSVDLSAWKLEGGVTHTIKSGTVLLAGESLYLTPNPKAFRTRTTAPRGAQRLFVQGNVNGHLSNFGENLTLKNAAGTVISSLTIPPSPSDPQRYLVISEIMYHPEPNGDAEYVELMNISPTVTLNLEGVKFSAGIDFTFPAGSTLAPGAKVLVVKSTAAFESVYATGKPIAGQFANLSSLSNGGEEIRLDDATGSTIRNLTYDDIAPWPATADGGGSIVLIAPLTNPDHTLPQNWRASMTPAGNPAGDDVLHLLTAPGADDDGNGWSNLIEYALGPNPQITCTTTAEGLTLTIPRARNADDAEIIGEFSTSLTGWTPAGTGIYGDNSVTFTIPAAITGEKRVFLRANVRVR